MSDQRPPSNNRPSGGGSASGAGRSGGGRSGGSSGGRAGGSGNSGNSGGRSGGPGGNRGSSSGDRRSGGQGRPGNSGRPNSAGRPSNSGRPGGSGQGRRNDRAGNTDTSPGLERPRVQAPPLPDPELTGAGLDEDVQAELRSLTKAAADDVGAHLAATALLLDDDPEAAYLHAVYARARASRVGSVREAVGIAAYMTGRYAEALSELRAVKRIHGSDVHLPVMADCQRGLGRPERALEMAGSPEAAALDPAGQVEMRIVASGARQDMGQADAAVLTLQCPQLKDAKAPWAPRLRYAYAEALLTAGRADEGREWMARAVEADKDASTDAAERLAELEGVTFFESAEDDDDLDTVEAMTPVAAEPATSTPSADEPPVVAAPVVAAPVSVTSPAPSTAPPVAPAVEFKAPPAAVDVSPVDPSKADDEDGPSQLSFVID